MLLSAHSGKDRGMCVVAVVLVVPWIYMSLDEVPPYLSVRSFGSTTFDPHRRSVAVLHH